MSLFALPAGLSPKYEKWLNEEVLYIISAKEKAEFMALDSDAGRDAFIEGFWERRDPDSSTEANEFREEHARRLKYVNETFDKEGKPGWRTDRGRTYIVHGAPDSVQWHWGGITQIPIANPTELLTQGGAPGIRLMDIDVPVPQSEVWVYRRLPGSKQVRSYFQVIFAKVDPLRFQRLSQELRQYRDDGDVALRRQRDRTIIQFIRVHDWDRADFNVVYAGSYRFGHIDEFVRATIRPTFGQGVDYGEMSLAVADLQRSPGDLLEENALRSRKLRERITSRVFFTPLAFQAAWHRVLLPGGRVGLPLSLNFAPDQLSLRAGKNQDLEGSVEILVELVREDGSIAAYFADRMEVKVPPSILAKVQRDGLFYQSRLSSRPGNYKLRIIASCEAANRVGVLEKGIRLEAAPEGSALDSSEVILCRRAISRKSFLESQPVSYSRDWVTSSGDLPFYTRDVVFVPSTSSSFAGSENLIALLEIYNPQVDPSNRRPAIELRVSCRSGNRRVFEVPVKHVDYLTEGSWRRALYGLELPLASLEPGTYVLEVEILDLLAEKSLKRAASFVVE